MTLRLFDTLDALHNLTNVTATLDRAFAGCNRMNVALDVGSSRIEHWRL